MTVQFLSLSLSVRLSVRQDGSIMLQPSKETF